MWPYPFKHWNIDLTFPYIGILTLSFLNLEFLTYPFKYTGILAVSLETFKFCSYPFKHWKSYFMLLNIRILVLTFQTLEFWPYPFLKICDCDLILPNIAILPLSFQTLQLFFYPSKHWNSGAILSNIGILT